jgi:outer membrane receptor protein involved in Fe transport
MNLRTSFSQTIGRPTIREVSALMDWNYRLGKFVFGYPDLKMVYIDNYDVRIESFFPSGDNVSFSVFYKQFENHIELTDLGPYFSWRNADIEPSRVRGIELEGKKTIFRNLEIMGNITLIDSKATYADVQTLIVVDTITRTMYGQAPYIINGILSYKSEKAGLLASASYNIQGPKLVFVTFAGSQPDVFELPRHIVDLKIGKDIGNHFNLELKIRNLLNQRTVWAYDAYDYAVEFEGYNYGTWYVLGLSYRF